MDIKALGEGIKALGSVVAIIKQAIDLLPDSSKKADAQSVLEKAERELRIAEATAAEALKYQLCRKHFPPVIMLSKGNGIWVCPECGDEINAFPGGFVGRNPVHR